MLATECIPVFYLKLEIGQRLMESSVTVSRRCCLQQCCRVLQCRSVLTNRHCLVSLLLRPGLGIEIISAVNMKIAVHWNVSPCVLVYIYCILEESATFIFQTQGTVIFVQVFASRHNLN